MTAIKQRSNDDIQHDTPVPDRESPAIADPGIVVTPSYKKSYLAIQQVFDNPGVLLYYGGAGVGKTTVQKRFKDEHQRFGKCAYHINLLGVKTPAAMLHTIAEGVHAPAAIGAYRNVSLMRELVRYLNEGDLLILDEAQFLRPDALDMLRYFLDEGGIGLVLAGNELVFASIAGKNRRASFAQLHSRVSIRLYLPHPTEADADTVLTAWGVRDSSAREYGRHLALGPGGLRQLAQVLRQVGIAASKTRLPVDHRLMHTAANALGLTD